MKYVILAAVVLVLGIAGLLAVTGGGNDSGQPTQTITTVRPESAPAIADQGGGEVQQPPIGGAILLLLFALVFGSLPLYVTLLVMGKLPGGQFLSVYMKVWCVSLGVGILMCIPCIGWITGIFILYKVYDMGIVDFIVLAALGFGFSTILGFMANILMPGIV